MKIQKAKAHALYICRAANKAGEDSRIIFFRVTRKLLVYVTKSVIMSSVSVFILSFFILASICTLLGSLEVSMSPSDKPLEEDSVVLRCTADRLFYDNLAWFLVANMSESVQVAAATLLPCRSLILQPRPLSQAVLLIQDGTNVTLELTLPNASRHDEGLYACQVENLKTKEKTCLLRRLSLRG